MEMVPGAVAGHSARVLGWIFLGAVAGRSARVLGWIYLSDICEDICGGMHEYAGEICLGEDIYEDNRWRGDHILGHVWGVLGSLRAVR